MAVLKCKMCGGELNIEPDSTICECEYCGTKQTVPTADSEKKLTLFARANRLRFGCEFDKAAGIYESIVSEFPEEAEAYWGLVLCKYGIEYVDDLATGKKVPTCHRSSFDSVMEDGDLEQVLENADPIARKVYREEAKQIEELRKGILEVSGKEEPYDIFISYKETDNGDRTLDSVIAQDIYDALTAKGYRVFFSRISLEDKLGTEYEPYIFAALNSAKLMLAVGTDYEYFNAVWVKNEWSRYLKLMAKDKAKHLIPVYKNIDAYDMPKEFAKLAAQDMGKVGALQDLLRGVDKLLGQKPAETPAAAPAVVQQVVQGGPNAAALLDRGNMALEDGNFSDAKNYFDQVLNMDARCAEAYLGIAMGKAESRSRTEFGAKIANGYQAGAEYNRAKQFASAELRGELEGHEAENAERLRLIAEKAAEKARIKAEKAAEKARIKAGKEAEEARIKAEKEAEEARIKAEKEAEAARIQAEKEVKTEAEIREKKTQAAAIETQIDTKKKQLSGLGIFKVKEKRELQEQIAALEAILSELESALLKLQVRLNCLQAKAGDTVTFGAYVQDNIGKKAIEWLVLAKEDSCVLLISKYALDCKPYNTEYADVTWESCTLRSWLNKEFMNTAFTAEEAAMIAESTVTAKKHPNYRTDPGNDTKDKIFLLSIAEAEKYFASDTARQCAPTAYAKARGAETSITGKTESGEAACWWWLRSPCYSSRSAASVHNAGSVYYLGDFVNYAHGCVRPALWINLAS